MERFDDAVNSLPESLRKVLQRIESEKKTKVREIRIRADAPLLLISADGGEFVSQSGRTSFLFGAGMTTVTQREIDEAFLRLCGYSVHSHENDIREGFLTSDKGHRAGICGDMVIDEDGNVRGISKVTSINLRIAREYEGSADEICKRIFAKGLSSVIIAGAPISGKTTVLRDLAKSLSEGRCKEYYRTAVIDSRREIAPKGLRALPCCDVLSGCKKSYGILSAIRSMSPQMVICDEIADESEVRAISQGFAAGAEFAVSLHAYDEAELRRRTVYRALIGTGQFRYTVMLDGKDVCRIRNIYETENIFL